MLVGLCVIGLCFNIIFRKDGHFPDTEIESNPAMKKLGIKCAKAEEMELHRRRHKNQPSCSGESGCTSCAGCGLYNGKQ